MTGETTIYCFAEPTACSEFDLCHTAQEPENRAVQAIGCWRGRKRGRKAQLICFTHSLYLGLGCQSPGPEFIITTGRLFLNTQH